VLSLVLGIGVVAVPSFLRKKRDFARRVASLGVAAAVREHAKVEE
jgi:xanthine/uracil permease